jgi:hypothetical protein
MHDALGVRARHAACDLVEDAHHLERREPPLTGEPSARLSPSSSSIAIHARPPSSPWSRIRTTWAESMTAAERASTTTRETISGSEPAPLTSLSAILVPSAECAARHTSPTAPRPMSASSTKRPPTTSPGRPIVGVSRLM